MGYFVNVDTEKKVLTIDDSLTPNKRDQFLLDNYLKVGYTIRFKSEKRVARAKERQKSNFSLDEIEKLLEDKPDLKGEFEAIKAGKGKGHGAFAAKSWFNDIVLKDERFKGLEKTEEYGFKIKKLKDAAKKKAEEEKK